MKLIKQIKFLSSNGIRVLLTFIYPKGISKTISINKIKLSFNRFDKGGQQYLSKESWVETNTKCYSLIDTSINPKYVLDIGANYGFLSCVFSKQFPLAQIISVEPVNFLFNYLKQNIKQNNLKNVIPIKAMCGEKAENNNTFSVNPVSSQDSRVREGAFYWKKEVVKQVTICDLMKDVTNQDGVFIKIDTQGFEPNVIKGATEFLDRSDNWFLKMEFSPYHLTQQGFDAETFLIELISKYNVFEDLGAVLFKDNKLTDLLKNNISSEDVESFVNYIKNKNTNELGWSDLFITPKINYK